MVNKPLFENENATGTGHVIQLFKSWCELNGTSTRGPVNICGGQSPLPRVGPWREYLQSEGQVGLALTSTSWPFSRLMARLALAVC